MPDARSQVPFLDVAAAYREQKAELDAAAQQVFGRGRYVLGPELEAFEAEFAALHGVGHGIGVGNGLDALVLALRALGIGPGDRVLVPAHTFIATWLAVSYAGAEPVPVEVDPVTFNMTPEACRGAMTPGVRALMPVHLYGQPAEAEGLRRLADEHGLKMVEDAAQAHGARLRGRPVGGFGHAAGFSFYPGKNLGAFGDGGIVLTDDDQVAERLRALRNYGSRRKYDHEVLGVNSRLDEVQAAMLRVRLRKLEEWNARRTRLAQRYMAGLKDAPGLTLPRVMADAQHVWHLFVVRHAKRDELQAILGASGVETLVHYPVPPHRSGAYSGHARAPLPAADALAGTVLSLPMGPHVTPAQADQVVTATLEACRRLDGR